MSNRGNFEQVGVEAVVKGFDAYVRQMKELVGQTQKAGTQMGGAAADSDKFGKSLDISAGSILKFGAAIAGAQLGVAAIRGAFSNTIGAAIEFESSFAGVRKTVDATEEEFAQLAQGFRDLAKTIPVNVNELNRIGEAAGQLGIAKGDILAFTETVAKLSATTSLTSDQAATDLARLANIVGFTADEFDNVASTIVALGNAGASTEPEILSFATRIAGAGKIVGLTIYDILGLSEAFASLGIEAEAGGTSIQRVLLDMDKAVSTGNDNLAVFAATAGMTAEQFATAFRDNAAGAFVAFVEGLGQQGHQAALTLEELELSDVRVTKSLLTAASAGDSLAKSMANSGSQVGAAAAINEEFGKRLNTTAAQAQLLQNRLADVGISVGKVLLPAINDAIGAGIDFSENLGFLVPLVEELMDILPSVAPVLLAIAAAMAAVKLLEFATGIGKVVGAISVAHPALLALSVAFIAIDTVLRKTTGDGLIERFTKALDGNKKAADAAKKAMTEYDLALRAAGSGADPLAQGLAAIYTSLQQAGEAQTKFLSEIGPMQRGFADSSQVTKEYAGEIGGVITAMQAQGVSATELKGIIESMPPGIREVVEANVDLAGIMADAQGEFIDSIKVTDGWMGSLGLLGKAIEDIIPPLEDAKTPLEEYVAGLKDGALEAKLFDEALEALLAPLTTQSLAYIQLSTDIAQLDQKINTLKNSKAELTDADKEEIASLEAQRDGLQRLQDQMTNATSVVDEYATELAALSGRPKEALFELSAALIANGRSAEEVDGMFSDLVGVYRAMRDESIPSLITKLTDLKNSMKPEEWAAVAKAIGPAVQDALVTGLGEVEAAAVLAALGIVTAIQNLDLPGALASVGSSMWQGMKSGFETSMAAEIALMASQAKALMVSSLQTELRIDSPSKVLYDEVGYPAGEGVVFGAVAAIMDGDGPITSAVAQMVSNASAAAAALLPSLAGSSSTAPSSSPTQQGEASSSPFPYTVAIGGQSVPATVSNGMIQILLPDGRIQNIGLGQVGGATESGGQGVSLPSVQELIAAGILTPAAYGERYVPEDNMLYLLHRGEAVIPAGQNPYASFMPAMGQSGGGDTSIVFDFSGATLTGDMHENEAMMRRVVGDVLNDQLRQNAYLNGVRR